MPGFWHTVAITAAASAILGLVTGVHFNVSALRSPLLTSASTKVSAEQSIRQPIERPVKPFFPSAMAEKKTAVENYQRATVIANQAVETYQLAEQAIKAGNSRLSLEFTRQEQVLWRQTLRQLRAIASTSPQYEPAIAKRVQYRQLLATAESKISITEGTFLTQIMREAAVDPRGVHITLCQMDTQYPVDIQRHINTQPCRHHQGNERMASPASLIKVPIAIALLHKAAAEKIGLSHALHIHPDNFTENAIGGNIAVDQVYPLRQIMARMIDQSNNVATNQLIDYLERDYIDRTLLKMGYTDTYAGHKLVGDVIMPANAGDLGNQSTTHDITAMMMDIYSPKKPEYRELLNALLNQSDRELGYAALQEMAGAITWIGEKTGQNDQVIATTLAVKIREERYALTIALDHSGDAYAMREIIQGIARHILATGPLLKLPDH